MRTGTRNIQPTSKGPCSHDCHHHHRPWLEAGHRLGPAHDVPAGAVGPGRPGRLQPAAQCAGLVDVRAAGNAGPPCPVPWPDVRLQPGAGRPVPCAAAHGILPHHRPAAVLPFLAQRAFLAQPAGPGPPAGGDRRRRPGLRPGLDLEVCAGLARPAHLQSGRGRRVPGRADRAQHCHLVGRDAGHALAGAARGAAGALPDPEVRHGRRLHRGCRVHRGRGSAPGRDGSPRGPVADARAAAGAVLRRVHAHRAAHPAPAALAATGAGRRRRGTVCRPLQPGVCGQLPRAGAARGQRACLRRRTAGRGPAGVRREPSADADDDGIQLPPGTSGALRSRTGPGAAPAPGHDRREG